MSPQHSIKFTELADHPSDEVTSFTISCFKKFKLLARRKAYESLDLSGLQLKRLKLLIVFHIDNVLVAFAAFKRDHLRHYNPLYRNGIANCVPASPKTHTSQNEEASPKSVQFAIPISRTREVKDS